jgi:hypothetical protein
MRRACFVLLPGLLGGAPSPDATLPEIWPRPRLGLSRILVAGVEGAG